MRFLDIIIQGLYLGSLYALIAFGFVLVYKATRTVNFAQASFLLLGAWLTAGLTPKIGFLLAVLVAILCVALVAVAIQRFLLSRLDSSNHSAMSILTIGVNIVLLAALLQQLGETVIPLGAPWDGVVLGLGGLTLPLTSIISVFGAAAIIIVLTLILNKTGFGLAMRASIEDPEAASLMGIKLRRVSAAAWIGSGILATIAGIGLASFPSPGVSFTTELAAIKAFPAAIIGGMDSLGGAVVGGLIIGMTESLAGNFQSELMFLGDGLTDVAGFVVMISILIFKPTGLFGSKEFTRV